ncbi:MAG: DUF362 domain-containing protein [Bacteroidota bacterium]
MKRRDFLKNSLALGLAGYALPSFVKAGNWLGSPSGLALPYDLVAIKGGEADVMFEKAIASLGGMGKFVKKGQTVVVKPNIGWDVIPERAANTNPKLVATIVKHCLAAGAKSVHVFDNTCDTWSKCYANSGIEKAAKDAGAKVVPGNTESYYQEVDIKSGKKLLKAKVHELILSSDVFINVPVLKSHMSAKLTISMKNLMGIVWDRGYWHKNNLNQCIADFASYRKPDLNIVDAYAVMTKHGPRGISKNDVVMMKSQIISADMVALDTAAAKLCGKELSDVSYLAMAEQLGVGTTNLSSLKINKIIL